MKHILACLLLAASSQSSDRSVANWRHDIEEIVKDIRSLHPDPFTKTGQTIFLREVEALKAAVPGLIEEQRVLWAMRVVALLGDGHTKLEPDSPAFAFWYPIRLYEFTDGYFVTSAHRSVSELAGAQVLEIAGHRTSEVIGEARKLMGADNEFSGKERLYAVHNPDLSSGRRYERRITAPCPKTRYRHPLVFLLRRSLHWFDARRSPVPERRPAQKRIDGRSSRSN